MKKLLSIFFIFIPVCITSALGAETKKINLEWNLSLPDKQYNSMSGGRLQVYDKDNECKYEDNSQKKAHNGISLTSKGTQGNATLICPRTKTTLNLYFDFNNGQEPNLLYYTGNPRSDNPASFTETLDISTKKKHTITKTIETLYDKSSNERKEKLETIARTYCYSNKYHYHSKEDKGTFCCISGYQPNKNIDSLKTDLDNIAGKGNTTLSTDCQTSSKTPATSTSSDTTPRVERQNSTSSTETMTVSGTVLDENNKPLAGATISYKTALGETKGTITKQEGQFELKNVPENTELQVSFLGYYQKKIKPGEKQKITLMPTAQLLDEVVVSACSGDKANKNGTKCVAGELSEEDSQAKIDELKDNAQKMKDKEQSLVNKTLGAVGIGATGIGGMQMASAMAEENADADAERAMRAYLATFHCNYGGGKNIAGGETNVELPGGNELISLYSEYVNLANDLKARKTALDMRPGIESESILDAATSGLYDDVAIGKTSGAYTSLARALMDPTGADAAAWAAQKEETADKKKTGMITAGVGAAGSLVGNLALNSGKNKQNKLNEILNKYDKKKQILDELESDVAAIPEQTATCPNGTTGTAHPNCTCTDTTKIYNPNTHACEACVGGQTAKDGKCECPTNKPLWDNENSTCIARPASCTPECTPTPGDHLQVLQNCTCSCTDGYTLTDGKCTCTGDNKRIAADGTCQTIETKTIVQQISTLTTTTVENATLPAGSLFKIGSYELVDEAKRALTKFITSLSDAEYKDCEIIVNGYTDPTGGTNTNKTLSQNRANAVKKHIESLKNKAIKSVVTNGYGESNCTCAAGKIDGQTLNYSDPEYSACSGKDDKHTLSGDARYAPCRRVEIVANCKQITTTTQTENQ